MIYTVGSVAELPDGIRQWILFLEKGRKMRVKEITPEILVLEYRPDSEDEDYGSCLWARFYFNLDNWELVIISDCGNYGYRWGAAKNETFLELMARVGCHYLRGKLCGNPKDFDYEATKEQLDEIFEEIESEYEPESGETFLRMFDELNVDDYNHAIFCDTFEMPVYDYTPWQKRICTIFRNYIQPEIRRLVKKAKEDIDNAT